MKCIPSWKKCERGSEWEIGNGHKIEWGQKKMSNRIKKKFSKKTCEDMCFQHLHWFFAHF
jgi:hypothetical protein